MQKYGFGWEDIQKNILLKELNQYETGDTILWDESKGEFVTGERARDIYYPEPEKAYPFKGLRGLLTLQPVPSGQLAKDLGFNAIMPYAGVPSGWDGDLITMHSNRTLLGFTGDEPDCRQHLPTKTFGQVSTDEKRNSRHTSGDKSGGWYWMWSQKWV